MARPDFPPGTALPASTIQRIREEQDAYDRDPDRHERDQHEWSLNACVARGCLPTGEPIEAKFGAGPWSEQQEPRP